MPHENVREAMERFLEELVDADALSRAFRSIEETPEWVNVYCRAVDRLNDAWEPLERLLRREVLVEAGDRGGTPQVASPRPSD